eukprot:2848560-Pyramimonas_sp.AAC.2
MIFQLRPSMTITPLHECLRDGVARRRCGRVEVAALIQHAIEPRELAPRDLRALGGGPVGS